MNKSQNGYLQEIIM